MRLSTRTVTNVALALAAVAALTGGIVLAVDEGSPDGIEVILPSPEAQAQAAARVYVSGAVARPGVYAVADGDRLLQVIEAAGGMTRDADVSAVNLAARVEDEDHWHVPVVGEAPKPAAPGGTEKLDLNTAGIAELTELPGIGEAKARAIVDYRETHGLFTGVEGVLEVSGIGPATLEAIRDLVEAR